MSSNHSIGRTCLWHGAKPNVEHHCVWQVSWCHWAASCETPNDLSSELTSAHNPTVPLIRFVPVRCKEGCT